MSRSRKLLLVGLVLAVGFGLAWPFRKTTFERSSGVAAKTRARDVGRAKKTAAQPKTVQLPQLGSPAPHVTAKMTSTSELELPTKKSALAPSFDLANHPALATPLGPRKDSPVTPQVPPHPPAALESYFAAQPPKNRDQAQPAYATFDRRPVFDAAEQHEPEVRHVVQNSDTLEKLAKRYLGDEGRALEIFDLNRDVLDNPHLLPINAQLRIPADLRNAVD